MSERSPELFQIDETVPHAARVYDYFLGGTTNFAADRAAGDAAAALAGGLDRVRAEVQANRAFLVRAVRYLVREAGIRQFLDLGTGIPAGDNVHAVALDEAPDARIAYVDKDPVVLAHAHVLLRGAEASTRFLLEDVRNPDKILDQAGEVLDLSQPVAVMMVGLLHHIRDEEDPAGLVRRVMSGVPGGSYLVVSHLASDIHAAGYVEAGEQLDEEMDEPMLFRDRDAVARYFAGLELIEPGLVPVDDWRPGDVGTAAPNGEANPLHVGVARKPAG